MAPATAVGVEMTKFDCRARTSDTAALDTTARTLPTTRWNAARRVCSWASNSSLLTASRLFSATKSVLPSGNASSAEAPAGARISSPATSLAPTAAGAHWVCPFFRTSTCPVRRAMSALPALGWACDPSATARASKPKTTARRALSTDGLQRSIIPGSSPRRAVPCSKRVGETSRDVTAVRAPALAAQSLRIARLGRRGPSHATSCSSHCLPGGEAPEGGQSPPPSSLEALTRPLVERVGVVVMSVRGLGKPWVRQHCHPRHLLGRVVGHLVVGPPRRGHRRRRRDHEVRLARAEQLDRGLRHQGAHFPHDEMEGARPGLRHIIELDLGHGQTAVLGQEERAPVGQRELGRGAGVRADLVAVHELRPGGDRRPLALPLPEHLDPSGHLLDLRAA